MAKLGLATSQLITQSRWHTVISNPNPNPNSNLNPIPHTKIV